MRGELDLWHDTLWMDLAACRGDPTELFFPVGQPETKRRLIAAAVAICNTCEVRERCELYGEDHARPVRGRPEVWGGRVFRSTDDR